jgi:hypothetical protein
MRLLTLYLRARRVPLALASAVGSTAAVWSIATAAGPAAADVPLGLHAVLAAVMAAGPGLVGQDVDLDRTAAIAWPAWRAAHVLAAAAAVTGIVVATALAGEQLAPAGQVIRDVSGVAGLVAVGAATVGASRSWIVPLAWTLLAQVLLSSTWSATAGPRQLQVFTWMFQPAESTSATVTAVVLGVTGILTYAVFGPRS